MFQCDRNRKNFEQWTREGVRQKSVRGNAPPYTKTSNRTARLFQPQGITAANRPFKTVGLICRRKEHIRFEDNKRDIQSRIFIFKQILYQFNLWSINTDTWTQTNQRILSTSAIWDGSPNSRPINYEKLKRSPWRPGTFQTAWLIKISNWITPKFKCGASDPTN